VAIPVGKDISIPNLLDLILIKITPKGRLPLLAVTLPPLYEQRPQIVDPLGPAIGVPGIQIEGPRFGDDGEADRVEVLADFIHSHDGRRAAQDQVGDVLQPDETGLVILDVGVDPQEFVLALRQVDSPDYRFGFALAILHEGVPFDQLNCRIQNPGDPSHRDIQIQQVQSIVYLLNVVRFGFEFVPCYAVVHSLQIRMWDSRAHWRCIFYKLCFCHFLLLHRVVSIGIEHNQTVAQHVDFVSTCEFCGVALEVYL
jgi:hypothetical protein